MDNNKKIAISIGITPNLLSRIDTESASLGMSRSSFMAMCVSTYFRNQEAMDLLQRANNLFEKAEQMQNDAQINLWNTEVSASNR